MERRKLFDSELKLMELVWAHEGATAKEIAALAGEKIGWNKNTTYTVLKKLVKKNALLRQEPNFQCHSLVSREDVCYEETKSLADKLFGGSTRLLFSAFIQRENMSPKEKEALKKMIDSYLESGPKND